MEKLNTYIARLLEIHDCVIIPDFGGFLLNNYPAGFIDNRNEIHPAIRVASFNRSLNINDGIMAQYISHAENISYTEALLYIRGEVASFKALLGDRQPLKIDGVGTIVQTIENRLVFSPDARMNYLKASFGLPVLSLNPAEKQLSRAQKINEYQVKPETLHKIRPAGTIIAIAASLVIAMLVFLHNNDINPEKIAQAVYKPGKEIQIQSKAGPASQTAQLLPDIQPETSPDTKYYIIGGSFKSEANARIYVKQLKNKGFGSQILHTEAGYYRVTYNMSKDSTDADEVLHKIKTSENQDAWILKW